ncbi:DUF262 domain-containing protein [Laspinema olomoucense]|uniref:DUF262 domain-containing protein n=1 Tax=Laspinema olomoucense TaxID=3231600 RepID=UPI0021BAD770|nr:DUF262 domain-containing protein [Laspinema sp. D3c]MCT7993182.1 DUF262 domain-containing protein [Laspinema sp. D3c]
MASDNHPTQQFIEPDVEIEEEEDTTNEPFDPTKIRVETRPMTIDLVLSRINHDELDLAPDFQREEGIWKEDVKSRLIESILIRIPLPAFYMDATNDDKWLVIDGLQRLSAIKEFIIDKTLKLEGLEYLKDIEGKKYDELPRNYQRRIGETVLTLYVIEEGTPPEVKYNIFKRINTGGLPLSPQELRHALNPGKATKLLAKLADFPEFKKVINLGDSKKARRHDHEFILGFLAYTIKGYKAYPMKEGRDTFLNNTLSLLNTMTDAEIKTIEDKFKKVMINAFEIFGWQAFRKIDPENPDRKLPLNKSLFEAWSTCIGNLSDEQIEILIRQKKEVMDKFIHYIKDDKEFYKSISQASQKVNYRFMIIEHIIEEVLA